MEGVSPAVIPAGHKGAQTLHHLPVHGHNGDAPQIGCDGIALGIVKGGRGRLHVLGLHRGGQLGIDPQGGHGIGHIRGINVVVDGVVTVSHVGVVRHFFDRHGFGDQRRLGLFLCARFLPFLSARQEKNQRQQDDHQNQNAK